MTLPPQLELCRLAGRWERRDRGTCTEPQELVLLGSLSGVGAEREAATEMERPHLPPSCPRLPNLASVCPRGPPTPRAQTAPH